MLRSWRKQNECYNLCNGATTPRQTLHQTPNPFLNSTCVRMCRQCRYRTFTFKDTWVFVN